MSNLQVNSFTPNTSIDLSKPLMLVVPNNISKAILPNLI